MQSLTTASRTVKQFARPHARCRTIVAGGGAETCSVVSDCAHVAAMLQQLRFEQMVAQHSHMLPANRCAEPSCAV